MKHALGAVVAIVVASVAILVATLWQTNQSLPDCGDRPVHPDCSLVSKIRPQSVQSLKLMITQLDGPSPKFTMVQKMSTNGISFVTARLQAKNGLYTIYFFKDSVTFRFRGNGESHVSLTLADHDYDGFVEHGHVGDPKSQNPRIFDEDLKQGLNHRQHYQSLYEQHFAVIADQLGL